VGDGGGSALLAEALHALGGRRHIGGTGFRRVRKT
jgi:hypothetical protein